jgi:ABC-type glycerol-3-phosphate transport system substrate-binding protein
MRRRRISRLSICALAAAAGLTAAAGSARAGERVHLTYWDKWTTFERDAMQAVVDDFNASQDRIFVEFMAISDIIHKTMLAMAGGVPPDLAGVWAANVVEYADKNALLPLDEMARDDREPRALSARVLEHACDLKLYSIPTTRHTGRYYQEQGPVSGGGAGSGQPPRTIAELDEYAKKLTRREHRPGGGGGDGDRDGRITQIGFLPSEPGWWPFFWVNFFGGQLWDGGANITLDAPGNIAAFEWIQSYPKTFGVKALENLASGFGNFASPQDPFMSGKLAMVFQGVWLANYIHQYAPDMDFGAAPFPVLPEGDPPVVYVDTDMIVVPRGTRHPGAFGFAPCPPEQDQGAEPGPTENSPMHGQRLPRPTSIPTSAVWDLASAARRGRPRWHLVGVPPGSGTTFRRVWLLRRRQPRRWPRCRRASGGLRIARRRRAPPVTRAARRAL